MNSFIRKCLHTGLCMLIVGIVFMAIGGILGTLLGWGGGRDMGTDTEILEENYNSSEVEELLIKNGYGRIYIRTGSVDHIQIDLGDYDEDCVEYKNGKLKIDTDDDGLLSFLGKRFQRDTGTLTIWVPEHMSFEKIELKVGAGTLIADELTAEKMELDIGAGSANISHASFDEGELKVGTGEMKIKLAGYQNDYDYQIKCGVGSIRFGTSEFNGLGTKQERSAGGSREVKLSCGVGSIQADFEEK